MFKAFLATVPILIDVAIEGTPLDEDLLGEYIARNTVNGRIVLYRRYYGLSARKPV